MMTITSNLFNNFFNSTFTRTDFTLPPLDEMPSPSSQLAKFSIQPSKVLDALTNLDADKEVGNDIISLKLLKFCAASLTHPITIKLFTLCLETSSFPDEWNIHKIHPLFKKCDRTFV